MTVTRVTRYICLAFTVTTSEFSVTLRVTRCVTRYIYNMIIVLTSFCLLSVKFVSKHIATHLLRRQVLQNI